MPTRFGNDMRVELLEEKARAVLDEGRRIAAIIATMGSTDAFGIDDLELLVRAVEYGRLVVVAGVEVGRPLATEAQIIRPSRRHLRPPIRQISRPPGW